MGSILSKSFVDLPATAKKIVNLNLTVFEPPIILWSIWGLSLTAEMIVLPFTGLGMVILGFILGYAFLPILKGDRKSRKTFIIGSSLANHGFTMGGVLCFMFAGEKGLALSAIFLMYFIPFTFLFIFPYAGIQKRKEIFTKKFLKDFFITLRNMPLYAVLIAIGLKISGIDRPDIYFPLNILLIISISLYYFTLGTNFRFGDLNPIKVEHLILAIEKFLLIPLLSFAFISFTDFGPDIKLVIMIQSFMPTAIYTVVTSVIFNLNSRMASGVFIVNSIAFLLIILPILFFFKDIFLNFN